MKTWGGGGERHQRGVKPPCINQHNHYLLIVDPKKTDLIRGKQVDTRNVLNCNSNEPMLCWDSRSHFYIQPSGLQLRQTVGSNREVVIANKIEINSGS